MTTAARRMLVGAGVVILVVVAIIVVLNRSSSPVGPAPIGTHGYDVSWPQCSGDSVGHMPAGRPSYVVLGLTHGSGTSVNPCLGAQLDWASSRGVRVGAYLVASYPTKAERAEAAASSDVCRTSVRCALREAGKAEALAAVVTMHAVGLAVPRMWIDVEVSTALPWSHHVANNIALLRGVLAGLRAAHLPVGVYTTPNMWQEITGGFQLNVPNWLPTGDGRPRHAARLCQTSATSGRTWLVQYTRSLDSDLTCPVLNAVPGQPGPLAQFRTVTLHPLSQGAAVLAVQQVVGAPATGTYDPATVVAVDKWQEAHHLPVTGEITPVDWVAMGAERLYGGHPFWLSRLASPS